MVASLTQMDNYTKEVRRVLFAILVLNLSVVIGKAVAGWIANSLAVMSDALHSSVDSLNNIVGLVIVRMAAAAPDREHPYGHGKFETAGGFLNSRISIHHLL